MTLIKECPVCGNTKFRFLFFQNDKNFGHEKKFKLVECEKCKAILINPAPSAKELASHYPKEGYYSFSKIKTKKSLKTRLKILLYNLYFNPNNKNFLLKAVFSPFKQFARGAIINKNSKLLDIGCGSGQFLYEMKQLDLDVIGVEPGQFDKKSAEQNNIKIINKNLEKSKLKKNSFDIITLNHVLEHLNQPKKMLREIKRILKPSGVLIIGIPNSNSLAYSIFGKNWYQLDVPRHLVNYSNKNAIAFLEKTGFNVEKVRYNSRPSQFSVSLNYAMNKKCRIIGIILSPIFLIMTYIANLFKTGDQIELYCTKIR